MGLILGDKLFELNTETRETVFFLWTEEEDGKSLSYAVDCCFKKGIFDGQAATPSLCINEIETTFSQRKELIGHCFEVQNIEEADEREDSFYIYEHEPLENYHLTVLGFKEGRAHIKCTGTAVVDGYSEPYTTRKFEIDCWLPIITCVADWAKYGI